MLCKGKIGILGVHTFRKLNSDGLYPNFAHDLPASKITELSDVSRPTINQLLFKLRTRIAQLCDASSPFSGEVEVDESYVSAGAVFVGRKGAGPGVKRLSSGFWNATGRATRKSSRTPPRSRYRPQSWARQPLTASSTRTAGGATMGWWIKHFHVNHGQHGFTRGNCPINGIESF